MKSFFHLRWGPTPSASYRCCLAQASQAFAQHGRRRCDRGYRPVTLGAEAIAFSCVTTTGCVDCDLQRMIVLRTMHTMTAGAGHLASLETSGHGQRLRSVEPAGAAVRPELALRIVVWNRLADEEWQGVVVVAIAGVESEKHVVLVAVAVPARIEQPARRDFFHREDVLMLRIVDMSASCPMTRFAADAHLRPGCREGIG
jgi:hypothetical protein